MEKSKISINMEGGFLFCGGWNFSKSVSVGSTFIREMRVSSSGNFHCINEGIHSLILFLVVTYDLTAVFFETGAMLTPTKSQNGTNCGSGGSFQS